FVVEHILALEEAVQQILITGIAEFNYDVVDNFREPRVLDQRHSKSVSLLVPVTSVAECHQRMRAKCRDDPGDRVGRHSTVWRASLQYHKQQTNAGIDGFHGTSPS